MQVVVCFYRVKVFLKKEMTYCRGKRVVPVNLPQKVA